MVKSSVLNGTNYYNIQKALHAVEKHIYKVSDYFVCNQMNLNGSETELLSFCRPNDTRVTGNETSVVNNFVTANKKWKSDFT